MDESSTFRDRRRSLLSQLVSDKEYQLTLFNNREKELALERTTDRIKEKYGNAAIMRASSLTASGQARDRAQKDWRAL